MNLAHRIALEPTQEQARYFTQACGAARFTWNWALAEWNAQYKQGLKPSAKNLKRQFNATKYTQFPWLEGIHRDAHAQPFVNLAAAWSRHFGSLRKLKRGEIKKSQLVRRPVFKKKGKYRDAFYLANDKFAVEGTRVRKPRIGRVRLTEALRFAGRILSAVVSRDADRWFISISVEMPDPPPPPLPAGGSIGVDLGIQTFAKLSTGEPIESPRPLRKALRRLRRLGRWHSRRRERSQNQRKAERRLARQHRRSPISAGTSCTRPRRASSRAMRKSASKISMWQAWLKTTTSLSTSPIRAGASSGASSLTRHRFTARKPPCGRASIRAASSARSAV